jgi:hypothetical protein
VPERLSHLVHTLPFPHHERGSIRRRLRFHFGGF